MARVNQQTLADRLGLSRATVSRCFTNDRAINPATRARVFDLAAELGYRYMEMRSPAKGNAKIAMLGVLICHEVDESGEDRFENPRQKLLDGISQHAQLRGALLDVHYVDPKETSVASPSYQQILAVRRGGWDGAILLHTFPEKVVEVLVTRFPCVSLLEEYGHTFLNCVDVDHHRGISNLIDLLVKQGHRRIGFFSIHAARETFWAMHRFTAYFEKCLRLGLTYRPADVINVWHDPALSEPEALAVMRAQTEDGVTAWVCTMDHAAYAVIGDLTAHGFKVPDEVSVTGFDGIPRPKGMPAATTLRTPFREMGRTGAGRLLRLIDRPFDPPQHILLGARVRRGETLGPVPTEPRRAAGIQRLPFPL